MLAGVAQKLGLRRDPIAERFDALSQDDGFDALRTLNGGSPIEGDFDYGMDGGIGAGFSRLPHNPTDIQRSSSLYLYNGYLSAMVDVIINQTLGETGIYPDFDDDGLQREWADWSFFISDADVETVELQEMFLRSLIVEGDALHHVIYDGVRMGVMPMHALNLPIDYPYVGALPVAGMRINGILYDEYMRPVDYEFRPYADMTLDYAAEIVPAERILHGFRRRYTGQLRGIPWTRASFGALNDLALFDKSYITLMILHAQSPGLYKIPDRYIPPAEAPRTMGDNIKKARSLLSAAFKARPGRDRVVPFDVEYQARQLPNGLSGDSYKSVQGALLAKVARGMNLTVAAGSGDERQGNFSSMLFGHSQNVRLFRQMQRQVQRYMRKLLNLWLTQVNYALSPEAMRWRYPAASPLDPVRDANAINRLLDAGVISRKSIIEGRNGDFEQEFGQWLTEQKRILDNRAGSEMQGGTADEGADSQDDDRR